jgi:Cu/Ag efflux protein CusF
MKKFMVPMFLGALALSAPAWAWSHVSGSINSIDPKARQITLDNGTTYTLQSKVQLSSLAVGDKVTVNTETKGKKHLVNKVTKNS